MAISVIPSDMPSQETSGQTWSIMAYLTSSLPRLENEEFTKRCENAAATPETLKNLVYAAGGDSTDTYAITIEPAPEAYVEGMLVAHKANTANTVAATLIVNSLGANTIKKNCDENLATGDIEAEKGVVLIDEGRNFQLRSARPVPTAVVTTDRTHTDTTKAPASQVNEDGECGITGRNGATPPPYGRFDA